MSESEDHWRLTRKRLAVVLLAVALLLGAQVAGIVIGDSGYVAWIESR